MENEKYIKNIGQITKETNLNKDLIRYYIVSNNFQSYKHENKVWIDTETENKLHHLLHITGKLEYLIIESKMNKR